MVSEAFGSLVPGRFFCAYVRSDLFSLLRLFTKGDGRGQEGTERGCAWFKAATHFTPVRKAGAGLEERERGEVRVILALPAPFSCENTPSASS